MRLPSLPTTIGMVAILPSLWFLFNSMPEWEPRTYSYVLTTDRGLISYQKADCLLGMVTNHDGINLLDENSNTITCHGYTNLTRQAAVKYNQDLERMNEDGYVAPEPKG